MIKTNVMHLLPVAVELLASSEGSVPSLPSATRREHWGEHAAIRHLLAAVVPRGAGAEPLRCGRRLAPLQRRKQRRGA